MKFFNTICPICNTANKKLLIEEIKNYKILYCKSCSIVFSYPMVTRLEIYSDIFYGYEVGMLRPYLIAWHHKQFLKRKIKVNGTLLDIGCGKGDFLFAAKKYGYKVYGIDINPHAIEIGKNVYKLEKIFNIDINNFEPDVEFDVITLFEVIEHLDNPISVIKKIKTWLKPDGYLSISVPNRDRIFNKRDIADYPPHHLTRWSKKSLINFLEFNGFEVIYCNIKSLWADDFYVPLWHFFIRFFNFDNKKRGLNSEKIRLSNINNNLLFLLRYVWRMQFLLFKIISFIFRLLMIKNNGQIFIIAKQKNK